MNPLSGSKARPKLQVITEWLKKPFKALFKSKPVRVLPSHVGRSLNPSPDWGNSPDLRERDTRRHDPLSGPELMQQEGHSSLSHRQMVSDLSRQTFNVKMEGYRSQNLRLMKLMNQLKRLIDGQHWQAVDRFIEDKLESQGIEDFSIYRRQCKALAEVTPYTTRANADNPSPDTTLTQRTASPVPVPMPSALLSVLSFKNGQVNLFSGDITKINHKVHPDVDTIVCPHRSEQRNTTPVFDTLADIEPALNHRKTLAPLKALEAGQSFITEAGKTASLGFKRIVHTVLPEPWDKQPEARLFRAYVSAIKTAHEQGSRSIAIPILGRYMNLSVQNEAGIAHQAIEYYRNDLDTKPVPPCVYLAFPENTVGLALREEHYQLNMKDAVDDARPLTNSPIRLRMQLEQALDGILPKKGNMSIAERVQWLGEETDRIVELISDELDPGEAIDDLVDYLDSAASNLQTRLDRLSMDEQLLVRQYLNDFREKLAPYYNA